MYVTGWYVGNDVVSADYEIRVSPSTEGGSWSSEPAGTPGDWYLLSSTRTWDIVRSTSSGFGQAVFEIRRVDETLAAASGLLNAGVEWEP